MKLCYQLPQVIKKFPFFEFKVRFLFCCNTASDEITINTDVK